MKAVIFDFDGVLADTLKLNYELEIEKNGFMTFEDFKKGCEVNDYSYFNDKNYLLDKDEFFINQKKKFSKENFFCVKDFLLRIKEKYSLFIVTGGTLVNTNYFLNYLFNEDIFLEILDKELRKTKFERINFILKKYKISSKDCVFVTDTLGDLRDVLDLNVNKIAVTYGYHSKDILLKGVCDFFVDNVLELEFKISKILDK